MSQESRTPEFTLKGERADLHPKMRKLVHSNASRGFGMIGPFTFAFIVGAFCLFKLNPNERLTKLRINKLMNETLDEIQILTKEKEKEQNKLINLQNKINCNV